MNNGTKYVKNIMTTSYSVSFPGYYHSNSIKTNFCSKHIDIILVEILQGIIPMGLSASFAEYIEKFQNMKMLPTLSI